MDYESLYILYQSRKTLLKILAGRGYTTTPFEKFGPLEIAAMAAAGGNEAFQMDLERTPEAATEHSNTKITKCRVVYSAMRSIKNRLAGFINELLEDKGDATLDPETTEVIVILAMDAIADTFNQAALSAYTNSKLRIAFFQAAQLVNNPLEHVLVPKHERMPRSEHKNFLKDQKIKSPLNLPKIIFHEDMIARLLGLVPGDIVKITRPSPTAGEYVYYRRCAAA